MNRLRSRLEIRPRVWAGVGAVVVVSLGLGCQPPDQHKGPLEFVDRGEAAPAGADRVQIGRSVRGRPIHADVMGDCGERSSLIGPMQGGAGRPTMSGDRVTRDRGRFGGPVLVIATIHGDEWAGTPLVYRLTEHLARHAEDRAGRCIVIIPIANPDGMHSNNRLNVNGVDLNRNFPANNYGGAARGGQRPLSEPESQALHAALERFRPTRIISIHQPLRSGNACIDYDGPGEGLARTMAEHCDLPMQRIGSRPGSLGSYAGLTLGIPIITLELPKEACGWGVDELWDRYGEMMLSAIRYGDR